MRDHDIRGPAPTRNLRAGLGWGVGGPRPGNVSLSGAAAPPGPPPGWPDDFTPLDGTVLTVTVPQHWPSLAQLRARRIQLLGITRRLGEPPAWRHFDAPQPWRLRLHAWDWAWGLAAEPDRGAARGTFARLWRSWRQACPRGVGDAWLPRPTAQRAWSWCGLHATLVAGGGLTKGFHRDLAAHGPVLRQQFESGLSGAPAIGNLKATMGLAIFLGDEALLLRALRQLVSQVSVQVLADGGHCRRTGTPPAAADRS